MEKSEIFQCLALIMGKSLNIIIILTLMFVKFLFFVINVCLFVFYFY